MSIENTNMTDNGTETRNCMLDHPFRVFFMATAVYAILAIFGWIVFLFANWRLPVGWAPLQWHSHEMMYGFATAAITGFVLTALTNWTGAKPLQGRALLMLLFVWVAGRLVMWFAGWLPPWLVAFVDLVFLAILAVYVFGVLWHYKNRRNLVLVGVLVLLFVANGFMHAGFIYHTPQWLAKGQLMGFDLIVLLIAIIGGRIIPTFTGNWLRKQGVEGSSIRHWNVIEVLALVGLFLTFILDVMMGSHAAIPNIVNVVVLSTAILHALRLFGWAGWLTWREPLLWVLHMAYLWLVFALALRGLNGFVDFIPSSAWQHALGVGVIGTMILAVMTRVSVGHTGRTLTLLPWAVGIYISISVAAIVRILVVFGLFDFRVGISVSAVAWVAAFGLFMVIYTPILMKPRVDGRRG